MTEKKILVIQEIHLKVLISCSVLFKFLFNEPCVNGLAPSHSEANTEYWSEKIGSLVQRKLVMLSLSSALKQGFSIFSPTLNWFCSQGRESIYQLMNPLLSPFYLFTAFIAWADKWIIFHFMNWLNGILIYFTVW